MNNYKPDIDEHNDLKTWIVTFFKARRGEHIQNLQSISIKEKARISIGVR